MRYRDKFLDTIVVKEFAAEDYISTLQYIKDECKDEPLTQSVMKYANSIFAKSLDVVIEKMVFCDNRMSVNREQKRLFYYNRINVMV